MKYYVVEIAEGDSKVAGKSIYEYEEERLAIAAFHSKLGVAMKNPNMYDSDLVLVMDEQGSILRIERYVKPEPEPTPETVVE